MNRLPSLKRPGNANIYSSTSSRKCQLLLRVIFPWACFVKDSFTIAILFHILAKVKIKGKIKVRKLPPGKEGAWVILRAVMGRNSARFFGERLGEESKRRPLLNYLKVLKGIGHK
ncbi:hypothetical protein NC653_040420 [Populus alba x Populus x berolinensis]|uniref:Uncharacterized protein n=1 Tax=Populus alba x Populus x berolinensis TaxID=444605 RepID=A0AAD6LDQ2_9ROSI|nr:hypothetical protein NC653_040420 [Populus alba x Populus x berolinensis]